MTFQEHSLDLDAPIEVERITSFLKRTVTEELRRKGAVVGISGGVDSSVVLGLCARSFGAERVRALILPEKESERESELFARQVAAHFGIVPIVENIASVLESFGCYERRDEAIRRLFPEYDATRGYRSKIVLPGNLLDQDSFNAFSLTILTPEGHSMTKPLPAEEFRQITAATNLKQRTRMAKLYYHAEVNNYAVMGTAPKNERDLGFFVKYGDGGADVMPIAHLYKTQVYGLAEYLEIPEQIRNRTPTTDTYSAPSSQEEFFFRLPFETLDMLWYAMENGVSSSAAARIMHLTEEQVDRVWRDLSSKKRATEYLRLQALEPERPGFAKGAGA
ncbi:MAG: NAD(+) synthase [Acidobacteriaceae bacterium]|nr:NAD(+) synthase [Acidobacteriaceae bacterium]